jgi:hypothetical protein
MTDKLTQAGDQDDDKNIEELEEEVLMDLDADENDDEPRQMTVTIVVMSNMIPKELKRYLVDVVEEMIHHGELTELTSLNVEENN